MWLLSVCEDREVFFLPIINNILTLIMKNTTNMKLIKTNRDLLVWILIPIWQVSTITCWLTHYYRIAGLLNIIFASFFLIMIMLEQKNNGKNKLKTWLNKPIKPKENE